VIFRAFLGSTYAAAVLPKLINRLKSGNYDCHAISPDFCPPLQGECRRFDPVSAHHKITAGPRTIAVVSMCRTLILLALCLALPFYGMAGLAHARSCPDRLSASSQVVQDTDCCTGKGSPGGPCKPSGDGSAPVKKSSCGGACKVGVGSKTPQSYEPTATMMVFVLPARSPLAADLPKLLLSHSPNGLWRPPRLG